MLSKDFLIRIIVYPAILALALKLFILYYEKNFIFPGGKDDAAVKPPAGAEELFYETADGVKIHSWLLLKNRSFPTLLIFHGNAETVSGYGDFLSAFTGRNLNIFVTEYRGYGKSGGKRPSEKEFYQDAERAYSFLTEEKNVPPEKIFVFGRSVGGGAAIHIAASKKTAGLITEGSFSSAKDMSKVIFSALSYPAGLFISVRFDNAEKIRKVAVPVLVIHGKKDPVIPFFMGEKLFENAPEQKKFLALDGAGHLDSLYTEPAKYIPAVISMLGLK